MKHFWTQVMGCATRAHTMASLYEEVALCGVEIDHEHESDFTFDEAEADCPNCRFLLDTFQAPWRWNLTKRLVALRAYGNPKREEWPAQADTGMTRKEIAAELRKTMDCRCDFDRWEPEASTGHTFVCPIHERAIRIRAGWESMPAGGGER